MVVHIESELDEDDPMMYDICPDCKESYSIRQGCECKELKAAKVKCNDKCASCKHFPSKYNSRSRKCFDCGANATKECLFPLWAQA
jgi:hypothetical protein